MKKILLVSLLGLLLLLAIALFSFPYYVSNTYNLVTKGATPLVITPEIKTLHQNITIVDLHSDALLGNRDLNEYGTHGHTDVPRLQLGNVALQAFTVVTQAPAGMNEIKTDPNDLDLITIQAMGAMWPRSTWSDNLQRALYQSEKLHRFEQASKGNLRIIRTKTDLAQFLKDRIDNPKLTAGLLGLEGFHIGELTAVDAMYEAGFRMMAPTHFFDSFMGGSAHGMEKGGLTQFGRQVIQRMKTLNIALDLAHASPTLLDDILGEFPDMPIVISHTGVKGTCDRIRNLSDRHLKAIAKTGGVIGIGFWPSATCGQTVEEIVDAIDYTVKLVGIDHVGLGSDFDGLVQTPFDATGMIQLTQALSNRGFLPLEIEKIMGGNTINYFLKVLPE